MAEILVFGRIEDNKPTRNSLEVIGAGSELSRKMKMPLGLIVTCSTGQEEGLRDFINYGVDTVYAVKNDNVEGYFPELGLYAAEAVCREVEARLIILAADTDGREIAPRLAFRIGAGIISECIEIDGDSDGNIYGTKPVYGGKAIARLATKSPQVVTLREHVYEALESDGDRKGEIKVIKSEMLDDLKRVRVDKFIEEEHVGIKIEDASIVISGGRGIGGREQYQIVEELSKIVQGAPAASRAAVDAGWAPPSYQVGQTGKIIAPNLYLAIGISGASQHIAGMSGSKCIVAINKDPDAPIFRSANFGIVDDYKKIVPYLKERIKEIMS